MDVTADVVMPIHKMCEEGISEFLLRMRDLEEELASVGGRAN